MASPVAQASTGMSRAKDMRSLGLTPDDLDPPGPLDSRRALARAQSAQIMSKKFYQRDKIKQQMKQEEALMKEQRRKKQQRQADKWSHKMAASAFSVNLVADSQRLEEEHLVRLDEERRRTAAVERRTQAAKSDIILRALQEDSDLEALRREKRAIQEEERRLKALLDLEKTNGHGKADRMAAVRAERMRHAAKAEYRRKQNLAQLGELRDREKSILELKHGLVDLPPQGPPY